VPKELRQSDSRYSYRQLDVTDSAAVSGLVGEFRPDITIHAAASLRDEGLDALIDANIRATYGLLRATSGRVVLVSSGSVYGRARGALPLREDSPAEPAELYGMSKRAGEDVARILSPDLVVARVFNLVGPGLQDRHLPASVAAKVAAIRRGFADPELSLGALHATRDFIDVSDAAAAIVALTTAPAGVYNVASGRETPVREVVEALIGLAGVDIGLTTGAGRAGDINRAYADVGRLAALGVAAPTALPASLAAMFGYFADFPTV